MTDRPLPAWIIGSIPKNIEIPSEGQSDPENNWSEQFPLFLSGVLAFLIAGALAGALAMVTALFAILQGNVQVLLWLFWGHLPWLLMMRRRRREMRRIRNAWDSDLWDEDLRQRSQGNNVWVPVLFTPDGATVATIATVPWKLFTGFELHRQEQDYFILRLWRSDSGGLEVFPLSGLILWPNRRSDTRLRRFARRVPLIITVLALLAGFEQFGWRADVVVALFLNLFYLCQIGGLRWIRNWSPRLVWPTATPVLYLDFAFDSRKISVEETVTRLRNHLPQRDDWV